MADKMISAMTELTTPTVYDYFPIIDNLQSVASLKNKQIKLRTVSKLFGTLHQFTSANTFAAGNVVRFDEATADYVKSQADTIAHSEVHGIVYESLGSGVYTIIDVKGAHISGVFSLLTPGDKYYLSDTAGTMSATPGTINVEIGVATAATSIIFTNHSGGSEQFADAEFIIYNDGDSTKQVKFSCGSGTTGKTTTLSFAATDNRVITFPDATGTIALSTSTLAQFAATTSAQLAGVISDETGSGALVFGTTPTFTTSITCPLIKPAADSTTAFKITKADGTTTVMTVDTTNGYVTVGTIASDSNLLIFSDNKAAGSAIVTNLAFSTTLTDTPYWRSRASRGSYTSPSSVLSGDALGGFLFLGNYGTTAGGTWKYGAGVFPTAYGNATTNGIPTYLRFSVDNGTLLLDTLYVHPSGVKIGTSMSYIAPVYALTLDGTAARIVGMEAAANNTTVPNGFTFKGSDCVTGGTADQAGGSITITAGLGKGTGASDIIFKTGRTLTTGSTLQTLTEACRITGAGNLKIGGTAVRATTEGVGHIDIFDGTDPAGTLTDGISIFSKSGIPYVINAAGVIGKILAASAVTTEALTSDTSLTIDYGGVVYKLLAMA